MKVISKRLLIIVSVLVVVLAVGYFIWQNYKNIIIGNTLSAKLAKETNNLYSIEYDSLQFDEITGNASLKNIRITPDTNMVKKLDLAKMPYILLDINIKSITVTGVKTAKVVAGTEMVGDSIIIDNPEIRMYSLKPLQKETVIESEASEVYKEILGKLNLIKVGFVFVDNVNVQGVDFYSKEKNFDFVNGRFLLEDVLIDSAHNLDTNRILFCRQATFTVDSFFSYTNNRRELSVNNISFLGKQRQLLFNEIVLDRYDSGKSKDVRVLDAKVLKISGINSNEIVKNKNLIVDTILCNEITVYQLPFKKLLAKNDTGARGNDSTGFKNVYSIAMKHLHFPKVMFVPLEKSGLVAGNISLSINGVNADKILNLETHPANYSHEVEVVMDNLSMKSKDNSYNYNFHHISLNSLRKELKINSFNIVPFTGEKQFARHFHFQKDRYDVKLNGITLKNIDINRLANNSLVASELIIDRTVAKIYRDLHKPLEQKSKVGNYPSQLLARLDIPVNISKATLKNAYIEYKENEIVSGSAGVVNFSHSKLNISNITNQPSEIKKNNEIGISFQTMVLNRIPLNGNFKYILNTKEGDFVANGHTPAFDAALLNSVSVPMGMIKINTGKINSIDFNLTGNNTMAKGDFVMKYEGLKVDILKLDKETQEVKKRGLASFAANMIVKNNNPDSRGLRKVEPKYNRDIYKSFFNLLWKTIFTGMKETVGIP